MDIKELLKSLINVPVQVVRATVISTNTDNWTCKVKTIEGEGERLNVRMRVIADGATLGIIVQPKDNSEVLIGIVENNPSVCYLVQCSEIVLVRIEIGEDLLIEISEDGNVKWKAKEIHFDGSNSGLIDLAGIKGQLNTLEQDMNTLKMAFQTALSVAVMEPGSGAPSAFQAALNGQLGSWYADTIPVTQNADIETDKITWP